MPDPKKNRKAMLIACAMLLVINLFSMANGEISGWVGVEGRAFPNNALHSSQGDGSVSVAVQPEFYTSWEERDVKQSITFTPFVRWDSEDKERTHGDLREAYYEMATPNWELRIGAKRVFWGVTEFLHLVDTINQVDLVENIDGEDRLGQPMVNLALISEWGTLQGYVLPYFRERTFPGSDGRLRHGLVVDTDHALFESGQKEKHVDYAVRWSHHLGSMDIGLAYFTGTNRDPHLSPGLDKNGGAVLVPYYDQMDQLSLDLQLTLGQWLWKLEALNRKDSFDRFSAFTGGFEYTHVGAMGSQSDLGFVVEYMHDDRDMEMEAPFQNDLFGALRWTLNDTQNTTVLAGAAVDLDYDSTFINLEASRRIRDQWLLSLEARLFENVDSRDPLYALRDDGYIQLELIRYF